MYHRAKITIKSFTSSCIASMVLAQSYVLATEYSVESALKLSAEHNDNVRLSTADKQSIQGRIVQPTVMAKVAGDTWNASMDMDLRFNRFNREQYDSDDQYVVLRGNKITETQNFGLTLDGVRDSTRTSEQDTSGFITESAIRRERYTVSPNWSYSFSDRSYISATTSFSETEYKSDRYTNYDYNNAALSWTTAIEEKITLTLQLNGSNYEPDERVTNYLSTFELGTKSESKSYGIQLGGEYKLNEKLAIDGLVGSTKTEQEYFLRDPQGACTSPFLANSGLTPGVCDLNDFNSTNLTADVSITWADERSDIKFTYSFQNQPSSQGYEVEYERFKLDWDYSITEKSRLRTELNYGTNQALDVDVASIDPQNSNRDFWNGALVYRYEFSKHWRAYARYSYQWQDRETSIDDAYANSIRLGINYQPIKVIWSR